jgi:uncharacterized OsmC-like protein
MQEPTAAAIGEVQAAFGADPSAAMCLYKAKSTLEDGLKTKLSFPNTPEHGETVVDEPPTMPGGKDAGPNPMDVCLGALATCQEISYKAFATVMGIAVKSVACSVEGELDLRGFLGVDESVPKGFTSIKGTVTVDAPDASQEQLDQLKGAVDAHCPMCDFLSGTCTLTLDVKTQAPTEATRDDGTLSAQAIGELGAALGADPAAALCTYKASSKLETGLASKLTYPNTPHHGPYATDEPQSMPGGQNTGPNPMDLVLGALTTCQDITYKAYATALGIDLQKVETAAEGDLDLRGFLGVDEAVRKGFQVIRGTVTLTTNADEATVAKLKGAVDAHCPMCATICEAVPISLKVVKA